MKRINLAKLLQKSWRERLHDWWADTLCRIFGHRKDVIHKMYCDLCPRCYMVVKDRDTRLVFQVLMADDDRKSQPSAETGDE